MIEQATSEITQFFEWLMADGTVWAIWATVTILVFVGLRFLRALSAGVLKNSNKPANAARNIVGNLIAETNSLFLLVLCAVMTMPFVGVELTERWRGILFNSFMVLAVLQGAFWLRVIIQAVLNGVIEKQSGDSSTLRNAQSLISLFTNIAIFAIALLMILQNLGQDVGALVAGLGVGGIAIALAAQSIFKDLFASLSIILDKPFIKGDFVIWSGGMGNIERIGLKTTRIRALAGHQIIVSNDLLLSGEIQNYKRMSERRTALSIGVTYQTPRETLKEIPGRLKEIVNSRSLCRFDRAHMSGYGDSAILFELIFFVQSREYLDFMNEQEAVLLGIHELFEQLGAEFAYPTQTVFVEGLTSA